jgi:hypothetical protein
MKKSTLVVAAIIILGLVGYYVLKGNTTPTDKSDTVVTTNETKDDKTTPDKTTEFTAPVVTSLANEAVVNRSPVVLSGTVAPDTESVSINGVKLDQYKAGAATWSYTLKPAKVGENDYTIEAVSKTGEKATSELTLFYQPAVPK